jgi:threonine/homoserine/homoserine lactone efflux protein
VSPELYLAFVLASVLLALTPGPAMSLIMANGASFGVRAGLATVAGNTLGLALLVTATVLGMSSIMAVMSEWFDLIRWLGAAYLIWLGGSRLYRAIWGKVPVAKVEVRGRRWFWQGLAVALSNPKVLLFLGAFFPHFVNPDAALAPQFVLLALTFVVTMALIDAGYAALSGSARSWFTERRWRIADGVSGGVLIGGGIALAVARR